MNQTLANAGFHRIGRIDATGRRSLWLLEEQDAIELRAGREGDDARVRIDKTNPQYEKIRSVMAAARFAAEYENDDGTALDSSYDADVNPSSVWFRVHAVNSISYHQWPPIDHRKWDNTSQCGILVIDDSTGYAVACIGERSMQDNRKFAESRLRTLAMLRDTPDEVADLLTSLSSRLIAASKACDALEDLNEIATKRVTELEREVDMLRSMVPM